MPTLLIVHHSPTRSTRTLLDAVDAGARHPEVTGVTVRVVEALDATAEDVLAADGFLLGTSVHFGYMSGALKHFFDTTFLAVGGALDPTGAAAAGSRASTANRPYGMWVHGRFDTTGGIRSITSIVTALGWRQVAEVVDILGDVGQPALDAAHELGATLAAHLSQ